MKRKYKLLSVLLTIVMALSSFGFAVAAEENPIDEVAKKFEIPYEELKEVAEEVKEIIDCAIEICGDDVNEKIYQYLLLNGYVDKYDLAKEKVLDFINNLKTEDNSDIIEKIVLEHYEKLSKILEDSSVDVKKEFLDKLKALYAVELKAENIPAVVKEVVEKAISEYGENAYKYLFDYLKENKLTEAYNLTEKEIKKFVDDIKNAKTIKEIKQIINNSKYNVSEIILNLPESMAAQLKEYARKYIDLTNDAIQEAKNNIDKAIAQLGNEAVNVIVEYLSNNEIIKAYGITKEEIEKLVKELESVSNLDEIYNIAAKLYEESSDIAYALPEMISKTAKDIKDGAEWFLDFNANQGRDINEISQKLRSITYEIINIYGPDAGAYIWTYLEENGYVALFEKYQNVILKFSENITNAKSQKEIETSIDGLTNQVFADLIERGVITPEKAAEIAKGIKDSIKNIDAQLKFLDSQIEKTKESGIAKYIELKTKAENLLEEAKKYEGEKRAELEAMAAEYEAKAEEIKKEIEKRIEFAGKVANFTGKELTNLTNNISKAAAQVYEVVQDGCVQADEAIKNGVNELIVDTKEFVVDAKDKVIDSIKNGTEDELILETADAINKANEEFEAAVDEKIEVVEEVRNDVKSAIIENGIQNGWLDAYLKSEYAR